jgi:hypothetical protein
MAPKRDVGDAIFVNTFDSKTNEKEAVFEKHSTWTKRIELSESQNHHRITANDYPNQANLPGISSPKIVLRWEFFS